ncbi:hypothetical protein POTOM_061681 [Populus tomentosa]|uniref:Mon2 C-terminal domain-containing protein n=1 Tax=Populus tomentosa TaxID=118781 RepID=A0A8X7XNW2_POPTO|nr:hypothetical protein POTOM_061681 [Populus tomentosa]
MPVPKLTRESSGQYSDFSILSSLNSQLFESSAMMHISAVKSLLSALCQLSHQCMLGTSSGVGLAVSQKIGSITFSVERIISILVNNLHRVEPLWDHVVGHFLELADNPNQHLRNMALDALDQSICAVLGSEQFQDYVSSRLQDISHEMEAGDSQLKLLECSVISPLRVLYSSTQSIDVRAGSLKILLHVLEMHQRKILKPGLPEPACHHDDGLTSIPADCLQVCVDVTGAYSAQKTELNISLTAIGLLWTTTDFIVKGLLHGPTEGFHDEHSVMKQINGDLGETLSSELPDKVNDRAATINIIDCDKLLFSVFSLLQHLELMIDQRSEMQLSGLFFKLLEVMGKSFQKACGRTVFGIMFSLLWDRASHMAATSSKDEWQGKRTRMGVLAASIRNSILNGSKEVAIAAINCLQTTVHSHCSKGNLPLPYLNSILDVYGHILQKSPNYNDNAASKVKQEILHGLVPEDDNLLLIPDLILKIPSLLSLLLQLGELYVQAQKMFDAKMFSQLLGTIDLAVKEATLTNDNFETEFGHVPPILRTILEILPLLRPTECISSMWPILLRELLQYLPKSYSSLQKEEADARQASITDKSPDNNIRKQNEILNGTASVSPKKAEDPSQGSGSSTTIVAGIPNYLFAEKLVPVLLDLLLQAPTIEKHIIFPEIIQTLGRCMTTRRDNPDGSLWRVAVEGFNRIIVDDVSGFTLNCGTDSKISKTASMRIWKEVADVYEIFLVGYCGRAIPSNSLSSEALRADEALEMTILNILGDKILKSPLMHLPSCSNSSNSCNLEIGIEHQIQLTLWPLCRFSNYMGYAITDFWYEASDWNMTRYVAPVHAKLSADSMFAPLYMLVELCQLFLQVNVRCQQQGLKKLSYVLKKLANLIIHSETASVLPLHPYLRSGLSDDEDHEKRPHLLALFPSFCELIITREARVKSWCKSYETHH